MGTTTAKRDRDDIVREGELRVLALDGGGLRGALIAGYLQRVERELTQAGRPGILESVDLIVGTSTGAIVGALLAIGFSAASIAEFYENKGRYVFQPPIKQWTKWLSFLLLCGVAAIPASFCFWALARLFRYLFEVAGLPGLQELGFLFGTETWPQLSTAGIAGVLAGLFFIGIVVAGVLQVGIWARSGSFPLYQLFYPKYGLSDLETEIDNAIAREASAGTLKLHHQYSDVPAVELPVNAASCRLAIVTYDLSRDEALVVKSHYLDTSHREPWKMTEAIRSSSAAPFFFPPKRIAASELDRNRLGEKHCMFCDGGVWANNPALVGFVEARKLLDGLAGRGRSGLRLKVCSVGTGAPEHRKYRGPLPGTGYGLFWWAGPFLGTLWNGQSMNVHYMLSKLMPERDYLRVNFAIPRELSALDSVGKIADLLTAGVETAVVERDELPKPGPRAAAEAVAAGVAWFS